MNAINPVQVADAANQGGSLSAGFFKHPTQTDTLPASHSMDPNGTHNVNVGLSYQGTDGRNFLQNVGNTIHLDTFPDAIYDGYNPLSIGFYGTHDDGCNVAQWTSTTDSSGSFLLVRGADWDYWDHKTNIWDPFYYAASTSLRIQTPDEADEHVSFRVVAIEITAEPTAPIVDPIAPSDLQPNTEEFLAARAAYVEANNKYHEANNQYLAAYDPYEKVQDRFLEISTTQAEESDQLFALYQKNKSDSDEFIQYKAKYDEDRQELLTPIWASHLQVINDMQQAATQRDQAEQEYLQKRTEYLDISNQLNHIEDQYDQYVNQYNQDIHQYLLIAYQFFTIEAG